MLGSSTTKGGTAEAVMIQSGSTHSQSTLLLHHPHPNHHCSVSVFQCVSPSAPLKHPRSQLCEPVWLYGRHALHLVPALIILLAPQEHHQLRLGAEQH